MTRRQEIENIIIGTLLGSCFGSNYYESCRCCITPEMFSDEVNRRIYTLIAEMNEQGPVDTDPCSIFLRYGEKVVDIASRMCELYNEFSFVHRKCRYNERQYLIWHLYGIKPQYTLVTFDDYVNRFIQIVFGDEREARGKDPRSAGAAA